LPKITPRASLAATESRSVTNDQEAGIVSPHAKIHIGLSIAGQMFVIADGFVASFPWNFRICRIAYRDDSTAETGRIPWAQADKKAIRTMASWCLGDNFSRISSDNCFECCMSELLLLARYYPRTSREFCHDEFHLHGIGTLIINILH